MSPKSYRLLIVDDVADNLLILETYLKNQGYIVDVADSGALALQKMQIAAPDLLLVDVMMPDMDGYELTRRVRRDGQLRSLPIVLVTAYIEACRVKGIAVGATDFVRKPIDFEELNDKIQTFLNRTDSRHHPNPPS